MTLHSAPRHRDATGKGRATRDSLVELAATLFAEHGYAQTSIRDIASRAGMTTGAIYGRFRNKADLLAAAISAKTAGELVSRSVSLGGKETDYVETLTRLASEYRRRRSLRSLIVQGAVAAGTDEETRTLLRDEQQTYLIQWFEQYEQNRDRMGIDPSVDMHSALLYTWAVEVGLGVLEAFGIEPRSAKAWADIHNRFARSLQLRPDAQDRRTPRRLRR